MLKKEKLTTKKQSEKEELQINSQHHTLNQKSQLVLIDSSQNDFTMMLWPKGRFTFSLTNGFEGEAEKILLNGKQTKQKIMNLKQETKQDSTAFKANYVNKRESSNAVQKNKLSVGYNWAWLLILPFFYVVYRVCKCYLLK